MSAESTDSIDAAIQSAESLFANLLDRSPARQASLEISPPPDLSPLEGTIASEGTAANGPAHLSALSQAVYEDFDPRESLTAIVSRRSQTSLPEAPSYDTLYRVLQEKEKDLELAANIGQRLLKRNELLETSFGTTLDSKHELEQQVAQLRHQIAQKDELLRLYARDAGELEVAEDEGAELHPEWVGALHEECRELRESNAVLKDEAEQLRKETALIEAKERELVKQCLEQFTDAKRRLIELREQSEESYEENQALKTELSELTSLLMEEQKRTEQLSEDNDELKEQVMETQEEIAQLTRELSEINMQYNETSVLLKEANDEITALKDISLQSSPSLAESGEDQHESIVKEIEKALRNEIHTASTLTERPMSPNNYAQQRTMVVMETVRAATLATARRLERLSTEARLKESQLKPDSQFSPIASSSPKEKSTRKSGKIPRPSPLARSLPLTRSSPLARPTPSPAPSDETTGTDEKVRYHNQSFGMGPQKLQIVKPMEGSVTLLKWKLLATPQLGGAKGFFSRQSTPGVHLKRWPASGIEDGEEEIVDEPYDGRMAVSAMDLRELNATYPPARPLGHVRRPKPTKAKTSESKSFLGQVGSFFSSRLKFSGSDQDTSTPTEQTDAGLGGLL